MQVSFCHFTIMVTVSRVKVSVSALLGLAIGLRRGYWSMGMGRMPVPNKWVVQVSTPFTQHRFAHY